MAVSYEEFKEHILASKYVLDPDGVHHELSSGMHGRKLDFDIIPTNSNLFYEWVYVNAKKIKELYVGRRAGRLALLSVANGTNRLVGPVAELLGRDAIAATPLLTEKENQSSKEVRLMADARRLIKAINFKTIVALEDVGTTGGTTATAVASAYEAGAGRVEVITSWQRRARLEKLDEMAVPYNAIIEEELPTYTLEECQRKPNGYCAMGWQLIPRGM